VYFVDFPGAKQSVVYVGRLALAATDPNSNNLDFANEVLGGGSSGKLFQALRIEKGYTYGAYSFVSKLKAQGPFAVSTSVRNNVTLPSLQLIASILAGYGKNFSEAEVAITRDKVLKSNTLAYESLGAKLWVLQEISKYGKSTRFIEEDQQELMRMSLADFRSVIDAYLKEADMLYLVVGDRATQLEEVKRLKGKVTLLDPEGNPVPEGGR
jgi:zinc protease